MLEPAGRRVRPTGMARHHLRRTSALVAPIVLALGLAACGDDSEPAGQPIDPASETTMPPTTPETTVPDPTAPEMTAPPTSADPEGYEHPTAADEVVVSIADEGGFMTPEMTFSQLPVLTVTGDARQFTLGPQLAIYPGPLLPNVQVSDIGEDALQGLLALADDQGLLQEREYDAPTNIADAADTVVTIRVDGDTYVHRAYALGIGGGPGESDESGDRADLQGFVEQATALGDVESEAYQADVFLVRSFVVDDLTGFEIEPTIVEWPLAEVDLATASDCAEISAEEIADTFAEANQLTFFEQAGTTYQLAVKPAFPGVTC